MRLRGAGDSVPLQHLLQQRSFDPLHDALEAVPRLAVGNLFLRRVQHRWHFSIARQSPMKIVDRNQRHERGGYDGQRDREKIVNQFLPLTVHLEKMPGVISRIKRRADDREQRRNPEPEPQAPQEWLSLRQRSAVVGPLILDPVLRATRIVRRLMRACVFAAS